jgi:hypothetical protein
MHVVNINVIGLKPSEALLTGFDQMKAGRAKIIGLIAHAECCFGRQQDFISQTNDRFPKISSDKPCEYTLAVSKKLSPASMQRFTILAASSTWVFPQALKKSPPPPNVPVPKLKTGTFNPDPPKLSMFHYEMID